MAERRPLVMIDGILKELPVGDTLAGGGSGGLPTTYYPPDITWGGANTLKIAKGRYPHGSDMYRFRGHLQDLTGLGDTPWDLDAAIDATVNGTFAAGSTSGTIGGAIANNSFMNAYLMDSDGHTLFMPFVYVYSSVLSGGDTVITPAQHNTIQSAFQMNPNTDDPTTRTNTSLRQVVPIARVSVGGGRVRLALCGRSTGTMYIDNVSIVERSGSSDDGVTTPTEVLFTDSGVGGAGGHGCTIAAQTIVYCDWTTYNWDVTKEHLITIDFGATATLGRRASSVSGGVMCYYSTGAANWFDQQTVASGSNATDLCLVCDIQMMTAETNLAANNDDFIDYRLVKMGSGTYGGNVYTITDSVSGSPDTLTIAGDKTAEIKVGDYLQLIPKATDDFCEIGTFVYGTGALAPLNKKGDYTGCYTKTVYLTAPYYISRGLLGSAIPPNAIGINVVARMVSNANIYASYCHFYNLGLMGGSIGLAGMATGESVQVKQAANNGVLYIDTPCEIGASGRDQTGGWVNQPCHYEASIYFAVFGWWS